MRKILLTLIFFIGLLTFKPNTSKATHIYGGDISYAYIKDTLGGTMHIYGIVMTLYQDCNSANWNRFFPENQVPVAIYEGPLTATSLPLSTLRFTAQLQLTDTSTLKSNLPAGCALTVGKCINKTVYTGIAVLPTSFTGYHFIYDRCCRTDRIENIDVPVNSTQDGTLLHSWTASTFIKNSSPKFRDFDLPFNCIGKKNNILNIAQDPDGHLLNYSLYAPFDGLAQNGNYPGGYTTFPPSTVRYVSNTNDTYTAQQPLGLKGTITLNGLTGYTEMQSNIAETYVVGVKVTEIDKNGNTIGVVHREYQFPFVKCNDTNQTAPVLISTQKDFEIDAGDTLCFDIEFEDKGNSSLSYIYRVEGLLFDTNFTKPAATLDPVTFTGSKSKQKFCWPTTCQQGRNTKYYFTATVADSACVPAITNEVFSITVNPPAELKKINGPTSLCAGSTGELYTTDTIPGITYTWSVTGGTIVGGGTGPGILVNWGNGPGGNIKVFGTNSNGCVGQPIDLAVFVATFPVAGGADRLICMGDTTVLGSTGGLQTAPPGYKIKWTPSNTLDNDTAQNPRAFPTVTTPYLLTVTDSTGKCKVVDTVIVTVGVNPNASAGNDTTICEGTQAQLNASGGTKYTWSPGNLVNDSTIANPITNITKTQMFVCKIEDPGNACLTLDTIIVTVQTQDQIDAGPDSSICQNSPYTMGGSPTAPAGSTFKWTPNTFLSSDIVANPVHSAASPGTTRYILDVTTSAGCQFFDTINIVVDTLPVVQLTVARDTICMNDTTLLSVSGAVNYTWTPSSLVGAGPHIITPLTTTEFKVIGTDANFCSARDSLIVTVKNLPEILIPFDSIFLCNLDTLAIPVSQGARRYKWTPNYNLLPHDSSIQPRVYPRVDTTYIVEITDFFGCNAIDSIHIDVGGEVPTNAGVDTFLCTPDSITLGGNPTAPLFNTLFDWSPITELTNSNVSNPKTFTSVNRTYTVRTTNGSCGGIDSVFVRVKPKPELTFSANPYSICIGDTAQIDTLSHIGTIASVSWTPVTNLSNATIPDPKAFPTTTTDYSLLVNDTNGCSNTYTVQVLVNPLPNVNAGVDTFVCSGTPYQLIATGASSYLWSPGTLMNDSTVFNPLVTLTQDTMLIVNAVDANGCKNSDSINLTVKPIPIIDAGGPFIVCSDTLTSIRLGGNPTGASSNQYVWSPVADLDNPLDTNPVTRFTLPRTYTLLAVDTNGCSASDSAVVRSYSFKANTVTLACSGDSTALSLYDLFGTPPYSYSWSPNYAISNTNIAAPKVAPDSSISYKVVVSDTVGCKDSLTVDVLVTSPIQASFNMSVQADCDVTKVTALNTSKNASEYTWYLNRNVISTEESVQFEMEFAQQFNLSLVARSTDNCVDSTLSTDSTLNFNDYFDDTKLPNVFTPNGDGVNDLFDFRLGNRLEKCSDIKIFNRWGELVFESRETAHIWDGRTFAGEQCANGVYFYVLVINGSTYKGNVTLVR